MMLYEAVGVLKSYSRNDSGRYAFTGPPYLVKKALETLTGFMTSANSISNIYHNVSFHKLVTDYDEAHGNE